MKKQLISRKKAVNILVSLLLFLLISGIILDLSDIVRKWLNVNGSVKSKILIVEGWIPPYNYDTIIKLVKDGNYEKILITGSSFSETLTLFQNGSIIIKPDSISTLTENDNLELHFFGSKASNVYPFISISINNKELIDTTIRRYSKINVNYTICFGDSIIITYINDGYTHNRDRNLTLRKIILNNQKIKPRSKKVSYKTQNAYMSAYSRTYPDEMAENFISRGLPANKIVALPSMNDGSSRTYTASRNAVDYLHKNGYKNANLVTLDFHSRRSKLSFNKIDPAINIGVISLKDKTPWRWYKRKLRTMKEVFCIFLLKITPAALIH